MSLESYEQLYKDWEECIRRGEPETVLHEFKERKISLPQIPSNLRADFAALFRRAGSLDLGLKTLAPVIRGEWAGVRANDKEVIEYCNCLRYSGLANEAFQLLISIDPEKTPEVLFNKAAYFMSRWNYEAAIEPLEQYLNMGVLDKYKSAVMKVNLAAAFAESEQFDRCTELLDELLTECESGGWSRLLINCYDIETGMLIELRELAKAEKAYSKAQEISISENLIDSFFLRQRRALLDSFKAQDPEPMRRFRQLAEDKGHWESVRDTDFQVAKITNDYSLAEYVYHGTNHYGFRRKVLKSFPRLSQFFSINPGCAKEINLFDGSVDGKILLKPGHSIHKLLNALVSDFYRPITVGSLFDEVFSGESFDPVAGPNRIHQTLLRTRAWLKENDLPLAIEAEGDRYRVSGPCTLIRFTDEKPVSKYGVLIEKIQRQFGGREFASKDVQNILGIGRTEAARVLGDAIESNELEKLGSGRATRYKFK